MNPLIFSNYVMNCLYLLNKGHPIFHFNATALEPSYFNLYPPVFSLNS